MKASKKKVILWSLTAVISALAVFLSFVFYNKSYYPPLPIEGVTKRELLELLDNDHQGLVKVTDDEQHSWYIFEGNPRDGSDAMIALMKEQELAFVEQMGAGYFFEDYKSNRVVVTSQMWTSKYVLFKVPSMAEPKVG